MGVNRLKAKYEVSYQQKSEQRMQLSKALPLDTPLSMQIELASICNFKCKFCIHGNDELTVQKKYKAGIMKYEVFTKIVDDMTQFQKKLRFVSLQSRGESLLNPRIVDMIRYLKEKNVTEEIGLNTNATLLDTKMNRGLVEAGLDVIRISIEAIGDQKYKEVTGVNVDYNKIVENVRDLFEHKGKCFVYVKIIDCNMTEKEKEEFLNTFGNICDSIYIEKPVELWKNAGLDKQIFDNDRYGVEITSALVCPRVFFSYVVHFDGNVVSCDLDWMEEDVIGNINEKSLLEIWHSEEMKKIRLKQLRGEADTIERCIQCVNRTNCIISDNIDKERERIYKMYE